MLNYKKAIFSDIDGTLSKGFTTEDFVNFMHKKGVLKEEFFLELKKIMGEYYSGGINYLEMERARGYIFPQFIKGFEYSEMQELLKEFFLEWEKNIYQSTKELVRIAHEKEYLFILITAGWEELGIYFAKIIGADIAIGTEFMKIDDFYTTKPVRVLYELNGKKDELRKIIKENGIDEKSTIGLGDSIQDIEILENVKYQVALNPTKELREEALSRNWEIADSTNIVKVLRVLIEK